MIKGLLFKLREALSERCSLKKVLAFYLILFSSILFSSFTQAAIPNYIAYQGKLTDSSGNPAADGSYSLTFRLYSEQTGGTALWTETQAVTVTDGVFSTSLGTVTAFNLDFNQQYWLTIQVSGDTEMSPRQRLGAAGYTINADDLDTYTSGQFLRSDAADVYNEDSVDIDLRFEGDTESHLWHLDASADKIGIGTAAPSARLTIKTQGTDDILNLIETGGTEVLTVLESGNVGIGTAAPVQVLDVVGNINATGTITAAGITPGGNITMGDDEWIGLSASAGRIAFDNQTIDEIEIMSANVGIGTAGTAYKLDVLSASGIGIGTSSSGDALVITSTGNVGIGTAASAAYKLYVNGDTYIGGVTVTGGTLSFGGNLDMGNYLITNIGAAGTDFTTGGGLTVAGNIGIGTTAPTALTHLLSTAAQDLFKIEDEGAGDTTPLVVDLNGNMGIGTVSAGANKLYVKGTATADSLVAATADINAGTIDGTVIGGASAAAGSFTSLVSRNHTAESDSQYNLGALGTEWASLYVDTAYIGTLDPGTTITHTLDNAFDDGKTIDGANSSANAVQIGDGTDDLLIYTTGTSPTIATDGASDLSIVPAGSDVGIGTAGAGVDVLIAHSGADEFDSIDTTVASAALAVSGNPDAAGDADGVIKLGKQDGNWEYIQYDASLASGGKFVFSAPLQVSASSPAGITFFDADDPTNTQSFEWNPDSGEFSFTGGKIAQDFKNIIRNGSFESFSSITFNPGNNYITGTSDAYMPDYWVRLSGTVGQNSPVTRSAGTDTYDGYSCLIIGANGAVVQEIPTWKLQPNKTYSVGVWAKVSSGSTARLDVVGGTNSALNASGFVPETGRQTTTSTSWTLLRGIFTTKTTLNLVDTAFETLKIKLQNTGSSGSAYFDAVQMNTGYVVGEYQETPVTDIGDQTILGGLRLRRTGMGRGGVLTADNYIKTRRIAFAYGDDPGWGGIAENQFHDPQYNWSGAYQEGSIYLELGAAQQLKVMSPSATGEFLAQTNLTVGSDGTPYTTRLYGTGPDFYWDGANAKLGIGTTVPSALLHLSSNIASDLFRIDDNGTGDGTPLVVDSSGNMGIGTTVPAAKLDVAGNLAVSGSITGTMTTAGGWTDGGTSVYTTTNTDNVGIGTTNPGYKLHVASGGGIAGFLERTSTSGATMNSVFDLLTDATGDMTDGFGSGVRFLIEDTGNVENVIGTIGAIRNSADTEGALVFKAGTNGVEEFMRITNSGNVGIGTIAPTAVTHILSTATSDLFKVEDEAGDSSPLIVDQNGNLGIGTTATGAYKLYVGGDTYLGGLAVTNGAFTFGGDLEMNGYAIESSTGGLKFDPDDDGTNEVVMDTNGNVGIGTVSPEESLIVASDIDADMQLSTAVTNDSSSFVFRRAHGTHASPSAPADVGGNWNEIAKVEGEVYDGSAYRDAAAITFTIDGTVGSSDTPGRMVFYTTPDGSAAKLERMRITNAGNVGIGTVVPTAVTHILSTAASDLFKIEDNGAGDTSPFIVDENGNLGIGTAATGTYKLWVNGDTYLGGLTVTSGQLTFGGDLDMNDKKIVNIGDTGTDFDDNGGLTLAGDLAVNGAATLGNGSDNIVVNTNQLYVQGSSGDVGIGTTSPISIGSGIATVNIRSSSGGGLEMGQAGTTTGGRIYADTSNVFNLYARGSAYSLALGTNAGEVIRLTNAGNVGIGSTAPVQKLHVEGQCVTGDTLVAVLRKLEARSSKLEGRGFLDKLEAGSWKEEGMSWKLEGEEDGISVREINGMAKKHGFSKGGLQNKQSFPEGGTIWSYQSDETGNSFSACEHSRGQGQISQERVYPISLHSPGFDIRTNDSDTGSQESGLSNTSGTTEVIKDEQRNYRDAQWFNRVNKIESSFQLIYIPITDVKPGDYVLSLNEETGQIEPRRINGLLDMGVKPVFKLTTEDGRTIRTTGNHPYLTKEGWQKVTQLQAGAEIALAKQESLSSAVGVFPGINAVNNNTAVLNVETNTVFPDSESMGSRRDVNQGFGEGQRVAGREIQDYLFNDALLQLNRELLEFPLSAGSKCDLSVHYNNPNSCLIFSNGTNPNFWASSKPFLSRNTNLGLIGKWASIASISQPIGLWNTYSLDDAVSSNLASETQSRFHNECASNIKYLGEPFLSTTTPALKSFALRPDFLNSSGIIANFSSDSNLTGSRAGRLVNDLDFIGLPLSLFKYSMVEVYHWIKLVSSQMFISATEAAVPLASSSLGLSSSDILWGRIVSIEYIGYKQVYDIEVEGTHNFIAGHWIENKLEAGSSKLEGRGDELSASSSYFFGGIIAHNTYINGALETTGTNTLGNGADNLIVNTNQLYVQGSSGNVGIGTTEPVQKLHVEGQCITGDSLLKVVTEEIAQQYATFAAHRSWLLTHGKDIKEKQIKDVQKGDYVLSLNEGTGEIEPRKIKGLLDMGTKPVFELITESGKRIETTGNHPYLVKQSLIGSSLIAHHSLGKDRVCQEREEIAEKKLKEIAQEHNLAPEDFTEATEFSEPKAIWVHPPADSQTTTGETHRSLLIDDKREENNKSNGEKDLADGEVYDGADSGQLTKLCPGKLRMSKEREILSRPYFQFSFSDSGQITNPSIKASEIVHKIPNLVPTVNVWKNPLTQPATAVSLNTSNSAFDTMSLRRLWNMAINFLSSYRKAAYHTGVHLSRFFSSTEHEAYAQIPMTPFPAADTTTQWLKVIYLTEGDEIAVLNKLEAGSSKLEGNILPSIFQLLTSSSQVGWDKIVSIKYVGYKQVYDIEVEGTHNFVANGIVAHNTYITGNVGIGSTGPLAKLDVAGAISATGTITGAGITPGGNITMGDDAWIGLGASAGRIVFDDAGTDGVNIMNGNVGIGETAPGAKLSVSGGMAVGSSYDTTGVSDGQVIISGNVGIGTTSPGAALAGSLLDVEGAGTVRTYVRTTSSSGFATVSFGNNTTANLGGFFANGSAQSVYGGNNSLNFINATANPLTLGTNNAVNVTILSGGNVGIGTTSPTAKLWVKGSGTGTGKAVSITDSADSAKVTVLDNGNVGIGTATVDQKLHVQGDIKLSGHIRQGNMGDLAEMMPLSSCILNPANVSLAEPQILAQGGNEAAPLLLMDATACQQYLLEPPARLAGEAWPEAGDVVIVDADGGIRRSFAPYAASVVGIISTNPAQILRDNLENAVPLALSGIVPCKASAENGPIKPGDLLVSSSLPGHAMRAGENPPAGTVIGKALTRLDKDSGVIQVLVMMK